MIEFTASASIDASPEVIWSILTDLAAYPEWDPTCEKIEGELVVGKKIKAFSTLSPGRAFPVKITALVPNETMIWTGGMPLGLFKGERTFSLKARGDGGTEFLVREIFSGPMLVLIRRQLPDLSEPFKQFAAGLKRRAEAS
jgi:hypothetical protein